MATIVQRRKGTTAQHAVFVGALGEITIDTDKDIAVVHDGVTAGGFPLAGTMFANIFSASQTIFKQSADNTANGLDFSKRGTVGDANAAVVSGVALGVVTFRGWDTATLASGGNIRLVTTEAWTGIAHGSSLLFQTVPVGSTTTTTHATLNSTAFTLAVPLNMGTHLINNVVNPVAAQDAATKSYVDGLIAAGAPPFIDSTALVKGSADATKLLRFEIDGFTAATTRVLTPPNQDATIAGLEVLNTFTVDQVFQQNVSVQNNFDVLGSGSFDAGDTLIDIAGLFVGIVTTGTPSTIGVDGSATFAQNAFQIATSGATTINATLTLGGSFTVPYRATAVTTTFLASDYTIDCTSGTFTVNLPTAVGITGRIYVVKNSGVGSITLDPAGAELIDGLATATTVSGAALMVQSTGAGWIII